MVRPVARNRSQGGYLTIQRGPKFLHKIQCFVYRQGRREPNVASRTAEILGSIRLKFNNENHLFGSFIQLFFNCVNLRNFSRCFVTKNISALKSKQGGAEAKPPAAKNLCEFES